MQAGVGESTGWSERVGWDVMGGLWRQGDGGGGRVLEEQAAVGGGGADSYAQYVWDPRYIDAPVCRFRDSDADGSLDETLYYCEDANFNITALVNTSGTPVERYTYDAYGKVTFRQNDWSLQAAQGSLPAGAASACDNQILFAGYRFDPESGLYQVCNRYYHPTLARWNSRDPAEYVDGRNLYESFGANPLNRLDPFGLDSADPLNSPMTLGQGVHQAEQILNQQVSAQPGIPPTPTSTAAREGRIHCVSGPTRSKLRRMTCLVEVYRSDTPTKDVIARAGGNILTPAFISMSSLDSVSARLSPSAGRNLEWSF